jgi:hypothetical protein
VNGDVYVGTCLAESAIISGMNEKHGFKKWTFMQDGASAHTKRSTMEFLRQRCNVLEDWPSGSPDLNPIENLWAIMKRRAGEVGATTIEELEDIVRDVWSAVNEQELANLSGSMQRRLEAVAGEGGGPNGY